MVQCSKCESGILITQKRIKCTNSTCLHHYHLECINFDATVPRSKWICPSCLSPRSTGSQNKSTPLHGEHYKDSPITGVSPGINEDRILSEIRNLRSEMRDKFESQQSTFEKFNSMLSNVQRDVNDLCAKYNIMREELNDALKSIQFLSDCHDDHIKLGDELKRTTSELTLQNNTLQSNTLELNAKIALLEQHARETNIEIQNVPERKNENLLAIVQNISKAITYDLKEAEIMSFHRVAKQNRESIRPRNIVVKLNCQRTRDNLLASVKLYNKSNNNNKLSTTHIGLPGPQLPIFVAEHLSPELKKLHAATRTAAKERGYKFVWVRNGRIFVRKDIAADHMIIKTIDCLTKLN